MRYIFLWLIQHVLVIGISIIETTPSYVCLEFLQLLEEDIEIVKGLSHEISSTFGGTQPMARG
jgi:hypothetical protein